MVDIVYNNNNYFYVVIFKFLLFVYFNKFLDKRRLKVQSI